MKEASQVQPPAIMVQEPVPQDSPQMVETQVLQPMIIQRTVMPSTPPEQSIEEATPQPLDPQQESAQKH